jgi:D-glycero-beta-D-manno-heptose-7-phosphate kinase
MDFKNIKILVVGDIMLDEYIHGTSNRISPEAPVPIVLVNDNSSNLGGAANVANNCANLGAAVTLIGIIGVDDAGKELALKMESNNINYLGPIDENAVTTKKIRIMSRSQQLLRVDYEKKNAQKANEILNIFNSVIKKNDLVIFSDYGKGSLDSVNILIEIAKKNHKTICVDPIGFSFSKYQFTDFLKPNKNELDQVIGEYSNETEFMNKVSKLMFLKNIQNIILTQSEQGCVLFVKENDKIKRTLFPTKKREVYDVTGAGDVFIAIFSLIIAKGLGVSQAIELANNGAGFVVERLGTYKVEHSDIF